MINFFVHTPNTDPDVFVFDGYGLGTDNNDTLIDAEAIFDPREDIEVILGYPLKTPRKITLRRIDVGWNKQAFAECVSEVFRQEWVRNPSNFAIKDSQEFVLISARQDENNVWRLIIIADKVAEPIKEKKEVMQRAVPPWANVIKKPARKR